MPNFANPVEWAAANIFENTAAQRLLEAGQAQKAKYSLATICKNLFASTSIDIDVTKNSEYIWRIPRAPKSNEVPSIILRQYEVTSNSTFAYLQSVWAKAGSTITGLADGDYINPYDSTYAASDTGVYFRFPYLSEYLHSSRTEWVTNQLASFGQGLLEYVNGITNISPAISMNAPQRWAGTNNESYTVKFCLFNTNQPFAIWYNHWRLVQLLRLSMLHNQYTFVNSVPPAIYTVDIPGIKYSPASYLKSLKISNLGNTVPLKHLIEGMTTINQSIDSGAFPTSKNQTYLIPDAYAIEITIEDMIPMSRQILYNGCKMGADGTQENVNAITDNYSSVVEVVDDYSSTKAFLPRYPAPDTPGPYMV